MAEWGITKLTTSRYLNTRANYFTMGLRGRTNESIYSRFLKFCFNHVLLVGLLFCIEKLHLLGLDCVIDLVFVIKRDIRRKGSGTTSQAMDQRSTPVQRVYSLNR